MKDFKSGGFRGGGDRGDRGGDRGGFANRGSYGDRGDRGGFNKKPWDRGSKNFGSDKPMFSATCGNCGKACQVPFKPVDGRPVFCTDCFSRGNIDGSRNDAPRGDFKPAFKKDFNQGSAGGETYRAPKPDPRMNDMIKQLESMNAKLDKLVGALTSSKGKSEAKSETVADVIAKAARAKADKKPFKMAKPVKTTKAVKKAKKK